MSNPRRIIIWFRQDLRLSDHPALTEAVSQGAEIIPVYILEEGIRPWGAASRWWLHQSLLSLSASLKGTLVFRKGKALSVLRALAQETGAEAIYWSRRYDPSGIAIDTVIKETLKQDGLIVKSFNASLLYEPWELKPYRVFTPFWRACQSRQSSFNPFPLVAPCLLPLHEAQSLSENLNIAPTGPFSSWTGALQKTWIVGEQAAHQHLHTFLTESVSTYETKRNRPDMMGTSRLSPYLHWGEISPRQVWAAAAATTLSVEPFLRQLGWREFSHHLLYHFPHMETGSLNPRFDDFPWVKDDQNLKLWQQGRTGYPLVDAGMRELWHTGWMHNRVRMNAASFLVKHLLIHWREGEAWFWDTLVDASMANNIVSWQWVAGCGADAAPYFRIFNPFLQAENFDPQENYIKQWAPDTSIPPIISHPEGRLRALEAYARLQKTQT